MPLMPLAALVLAFPAAGGLVLALFGRYLPRLVAQLVGPGAVWLAFLCALGLLGGTLSNSAAQSYSYWTWISAGSFHVPFELYVDRLSVYMTLVITGVGALIATYAVGYVAHEGESSFARFFCFMDVFILSMLILVLSGNFVFLIVGWAGVGLSSYLLIGFWYWRHAAVVAARKAFIMNVIGDVTMILATFSIWINTHQVSYAAVFSRIPHTDQPWLEVTCFLLLVSACAKSAQLPLHTWLPDAMEGPTPVSALIHAATMVTAGVYLVARMHILYAPAIYAHDAVAIVGAATALFAATIAIVQTDIKRVLAYSTMSQIGYMVMAVGMSEYSAGLFHLLSHAFFKALLFMAAGNIIHSMADEQDIRKYGGLLRQLPVTSLCFLVGALSLSGIMPFIGFWSKDLLLGEELGRDTTLSITLWAVGTLTAFLTAFYTGRLWWIAFMGKPSPDRPVEHPHEAPLVMLIPVVVLAILATLGGFFDVGALFGTSGPEVVSSFLAPVVGEVGWKDSPFDVPITLATVALAIVFFLLPYFFYVAPKRWPVWSGALPGVQSLLEHKYFVDELYDALFVGPTDTVARDGDRMVEMPVIDGTGVAVAEVASGAAGRFSLLQSGYFRSYMVVFMVGAVVAVLIVLTRL